MKNKITLINIGSSLVLQLVTIISGFIIPKLILNAFGSEVNGLVSSINQFLSYITLLEGGVSGVIVANLYKPLVEQDEEKINLTLKTANCFYKKIGLIFAFYALIVACIYPLIFNTSFSYAYICSLTIILALNLFIQYMFSLTYKTLLNADKKVYIVSIVQIFITIINIIISIILIKIFPSIHILKLIVGLLYIIQPVIYGMYVKKNYNLNFNVKSDNKLLKQRWDGFAVNVAYFIHSCTDITVLTFFSNLATVSVYTVYYMVINGLKSIITSITSGINPTLGQAYAKGDIEEINEKIDIYEYIVNLLVFYMFSIAGLLITSFVLLYTKGINDANYNQPVFGILLILSEALYLLKFPHLNLAYTANKFKELTKPAFIEAIINIVISVILVSKFGIIGVAIGTIIAMLYRMIFHVKFTKEIIGRKQSIFYSKLFIFLITTFIGILTCTLIVPPIKVTIFSWFIHAVIYLLIMGIIYLIMSIIFYKKELKFFIKYIKL